MWRYLIVIGTMMVADLQRDPVILAHKTREQLLSAIDEGKLHRPYGYQAKRLASTSRFNLDLWSRQSGKSQTNAQDSVHLGNVTGESVMCLSASQDLTRELMIKVAIYAEVISGVAGEIQRAVMEGELDEVLYVDKNKIKITQTTITLPNGARVVGRPANPRTARGFSMHVKLDEFGMHNDPDEIWAAAFPSITSRPNLRLDVMSTPGLRTDDKFADLCGAAERGENDFNFQKVTIHDAIRAGLPADAELLKRNLRDDDRWRREYLCEFVDEAGTFLTYEMIRACEHEGIRCGLPPDPRDWDEKSLGWNPDDGDLHLGIDIGRKKDLTVFWLLQRLGDVSWTRALVCMRNVPFAEQEAFGNALLETLPVRRTCVDSSGLGMHIAELWAKRFGTHAVEQVTFTANIKQELAESMRPKFQDKLVRIPVGVEIRDDLHSVRKTSTQFGRVRYEGERTEGGHADRFWALALALHAGKSGVHAGAVCL